MAVGLPDLLYKSLGLGHHVAVPEQPRGQSETIPHRRELERRLNAEIVTFDDNGVLKPGGMCNCCGSGPNVNPDWRDEPWFVFKAGMCDADGVFYAMLCEGCLEEIREQNARRPQTIRDEQAAIINNLMGDDLDGAQSMMDDMMLAADESEPATEQNESARFELGQVVMTRGVEAATTDEDRMQAIHRHATQDWGDVCEEDARQNDWALKNSARILSSYASASGTKFWIITEADRSVTTLLLPEEY